MKQLWSLVLALVVLLAVPSFAQEHGKSQGEQPKHEEQHAGPQAIHQNPPRANNGRIPRPPEPRKEPNLEREVERDGGGHVNEAPHVRNDHWYGHDRRDDDRFRIEHPFGHGHFAHFGPSYRYRVLRVDLDHHRFWFPGGFFFEVASWDWHECADWCWNCGDDLVVYEDPDHPGWYLVYNVHTGVYVHAQYLGS
jgi:hypothetical protein